MDNRNIPVILLFAAVMLLVVGLLLSVGKSKGRDAKSERTARGKSIKGRDSGDSNSALENRGSASGGASGYGTGNSKTSGSFGKTSSASFANSHSSSELVPRKTYTEEEMKELRRQREAVLEKVFARKVKWLRDQIDDENLSKKSKYRYRLQLIEGYRAGNDAFNNKDYAEALKQYMSALKDPDASIETKFTCLSQMRMTAKMLQDYDLYLELLKQQAQLIETEDLSIFGIPKGKKGWPLYESRRRYIMAIKEPDGFEKAVRELTRNNPDGPDSDEIRQKFEADLKEFKEDFDNTRSMIEGGNLL